MATKKITDYPVVKLMMNLEKELYNVFDHTPKKFRFTLEQYLKDAMNAAVTLLVKCMDTLPLNDELKFLKRNMLVEAHSYIRVVEIRLNQFNDLKAMSDKTKVKLDMKLYEIYKHLDRFINSLTKQLKDDNVVNAEDFFI